MDLKLLKLTPRRKQLLEKMFIFSVEDLLKTYPMRYETIETIPYKDWQPSMHVCFEGLISSVCRVIRLQKNRSMTKFSVISWDEELEITIFNRPWTNQFTFGKKISLFGVYQGNNKVVVSTYNFKPLKEQVGLKPVYSLIEGLKQNDMLTMISNALEFVDQMESLVPLRLQEKYRLLNYPQALRWIHQPKTQNELNQAVRTLKYQEFLCFQCVMQASQANTKEHVHKQEKVFDGNMIQTWVQQFPYTLTSDQQTSIEAVLNDMKSSKIMFRLVQGDVGCGKTIVAMTAIYACYLSNHQAAFLVPTEILARQHYENMQKLGLETCLYVSSLPTKEKQQILTDLSNGKIKIVVGTHALFQEQVEFKDLGLVVTDEQQRFGVKQRRSLLEKGKSVDFLMMSATPIPRTYAHFIYGDLDISNIHTMPAGRKPVITKYIPSKSMASILKDILDGIQIEKRQCYVVCPSIEDNEDTNLRSVTSIYQGMKSTLKNSVAISLLHGKMSSEEKEEIMNDFANHKIDILVSTTVIEVGIDVKNATLMVIYDAHRFGLSTLHQLRGRVARGEKQGYCYLLSNTKDPNAIQRLKKMEELSDGFQVSEYDFHMRGPGDMLGVRQSGLPGFVFGDLQKDKAMMEACIKDAKEILNRNDDKPLLEFVDKALENAQYFD